MLIPSDHINPAPVRRRVQPKRWRRASSRSAALGRRDTIPAATPDSPSPRPLEPLIELFIATFGFAWRPRTRRKHRDDFTRFTDWLRAGGRPLTLASFDFLTLASFVAELRVRPKVHGVWRGAPGARARSLANADGAMLSANTINSYIRPLRSFAIWLADEGIQAQNPFRRSRRRSAYDPLLPTEETPPKGASLEDLRTLERGCDGDRPIDLRDRAIVSILTTTAARNSSVRLLSVGDIDFEREIILFRRAKGAKTHEIALHASTGRAILAYLAFGRPTMVRRIAATGSDDAPLFVSHATSQGIRPLTVGALSWMLTKRYRRGGGTLPYFGSHRIRHGTATMLVNNGMPLDEVSRYLGHSSTAPTRRYAQQTPTALGVRAADALARAGLA
jgi:integrase